MGGPVGIGTVNPGALLVLGAGGRELLRVPADVDPAELRALGFPDVAAKLEQGRRREDPRPTERMFPVLGSRWPDAPREVPWAFLEPHRRQALENHDQTLERLAERGGLDPTEMVAALEDRHWRNVRQIEAVDRLKELLADWRARNEGGAG